MTTRHVFSHGGSSSRHLYAVGRVRALENKLLGREVYRNLIGAAGVLEALDGLGETVLNPFVEPYREEADFESILLDVHAELIDTTNELTSYPELTDLMIAPYDVENAKRLVAVHWYEVELPEVKYYNGLAPVELLGRSIADHYYTDLPGYLAAGLGRAEEVQRNDGGRRLLDHCLDQALMLHQIKTATAKKSKYLNDYFKSSIDLSNFMTYLRLKLLDSPITEFRDYYTPFGRIDLSVFEGAAEEPLEAQGKGFAETDYGVLIADGLEDFKERGTLFRFESMIKNFLLERLLDGRRITFGVEPLLAYFALRENEIRVIRAILVAKANGIKPETLRERLLIDHV